MTNLVMGILGVMVLGLNLLVIARALSPTTTMKKQVISGSVIAFAGAMIIGIGTIVFTGIAKLWGPYPQSGYAIASLGLSVLVIGFTAIIRAKGHRHTKGIEKGAWIAIGVAAGLFVIVLCLSLFGILPNLS